MTDFKGHLTGAAGRGTFELPENVAVVEGSSVLEQGQRLSRSLLWQRQRRYFDHQHIRAWNRGEVPHYITSNPVIAHAYAQVVAAWRQDWRRLARAIGSAVASALDDTHPLYVIELGAGSGRFAYHFVKAIQALDRGRIDRKPPIKYVMTDFSEAIISFWRDHSSLRPYVEAGILDMAQLDVTAPAALCLRHCGERLTREQVRNPIVLIANYVFGAVPTDAFSVESGGLRETLVTLTFEQSEPDLDDPDLLTNLAFSFEHRPIDTNYYEEPWLNRILQHYQQRLTDSTFLFPVAALQCLELFRDLSGGRLLLLSADKGYDREDVLIEQRDPGVGIHGGSISVMTNYHAVGEYVRNQDGGFLSPAHHHASLRVVAGLFGLPRAEQMQTHETFDDVIGAGGPDDYFTLSTVLARNSANMSLHEILAYLRFCRWDATVLLRCLPAIAPQVGGASEAIRHDLYQVIGRVWANHFPIGEDSDLAGALASILYLLGRHDEALEYLHHSIAERGETAPSLYLMASCHDALHRAAAASDCVDRALALDPAHAPSRALRIKLAALGDGEPRDASGEDRIDVDRRAERDVVDARNEHG